MVNMVGQVGVGPTSPALWPCFSGPTPVLMPSLLVDMVDGATPNGETDLGHRRLS